MILKKNNMSMLINTKFNLRGIVFLSTDVDQKARIVTGICIRDTGVNYELSCGSTTSWHYDFEMTEEKDVLKSMVDQ